MQPHPVQLVVEDDLRRSRVTVFFRILLAIPHLIWVFLWSIATFFVAIVMWIATLVMGRPPAGMHRFMCSYLRYVTHLEAYLHLVGNPYPGFVGEEGEYPIDLKLPEPGPQSRVKTFFRIFLVLPALAVSSVLAGAPVTRVSFSAKVNGRGGGGGTRYAPGVGGLLTAVSFLGWFASLVRGRMPKGFRDAGAYSLGYGAQTYAYLLFITDRYPNADPASLLDGVEPPPEHPVRTVGDPEDLRRSRVTVFFRLPLFVPHYVWFYLWSIAAAVAVFLNWFVTLFRGRPAAPLHRFLSAYVRYGLHIFAFLFLAANPFPGFTGKAGTYPVDLVLPEPGRQNRWVTFFRVVLVVPALIVAFALFSAMGAAAFIMWFVALVRGEAPRGLRNLSVYGLRYWSQANAYYHLLTDVYPHSSPLEGAPEQQPQLALDLAPAE